MRYFEDHKQYPLHGIEKFKTKSFVCNLESCFQSAVEKSSFSREALKMRCSLI